MTSLNVVCESFCKQKYEIITFFGNLLITNEMSDNMYVI